MTTLKDEIRKQPAAKISRFNTAIVATVLVAAALAFGASVAFVLISGDRTTTARRAESCAVFEKIFKGNREDTYQNEKRVREDARYRAFFNITSKDYPYIHRLTVKQYERYANRELPSYCAEYNKPDEPPLDKFPLAGAK